MTIDVLRYFFRYNAWATEMVLSAAEQLSEEQYNAPGCSGMGSVRDTLAHVLMAQQRWIETMKGSLSAEEKMKLPFTPAEIPTVAQARERWKGIAALTDAYLASLSDEQVLGEITLNHPTRGELKAVHWPILLHLANHGTHHRAQIFASVRRAGFDPGGSDLLFFARSPAGALA